MCPLSLPWVIWKHLRASRCLSLFQKGSYQVIPFPLHLASPPPSLRSLSHLTGGIGDIVEYLKEVQDVPLVNVEVSGTSIVFTVASPNDVASILPEFSYSRKKVPKTKTKKNKRKCKRKKRMYQCYLQLMQYH